MRLGVLGRRELLDDDDVRHWYNNMGQGSKITADHYLRRLGRVCTIFNTNPNAIARMSSRDAYTFLLDVVTELQNRGQVGANINNSVKAVKNWLGFNEVQVTGRIKIRGVDERTRLADERVPEWHELKAILRFAGDRARTAICLMAFSGVRPGVIGNYDGTDGLKIADLPEMRFDNDHNTISFSLIPTQVKVRNGLSKIRREYFTFQPEEGCQAIKLYLEKRMREGETLTPQSPIVSNAGGRTITTKAVSAIIRSTIRNAGFKWRVYVLRCYFATRLMQAEARAEIGLIRDWRTFFMGHRGDVEHTYTVEKQKLTDDLVEQMRSAYRRAAEAYLQTTTQGRSLQPPSRMEFRRIALESLGFTEEELRKVDIEKATSEQLQHLISKKFSDTKKDAGGEQLVVSEREARQYINKHRWTQIDRWSDGSIVIRSPTVNDPTR